MTAIDIPIPAQAWRRIFRVTSALTAISVALSVILSNLLMETFSAGLNVPGLMVAIVLPLALGGPMTAMFMLKHEQLRHANTQLKRLATVDALTGILNRGAFAAGVEKQLQSRNGKGALLVIDADYFKAINDRYGHDRGDEALRLIADAISANVGPSDIVGRLGGEEFGVYMPNADIEAAGHSAEHICRQINAITFAPDGHTQTLSVSIGGAAHAGPMAFRALYRLADDRLYLAKQAGRNQITLREAA